MARVRVTIDQKAINRYFTEDAIAQRGLRQVAEAYKDVASAATPIGRSTGKFVSKGEGQSRIVRGPFGTPYRHGFARRGAYHVRRYRGGYRVYTRDRFAHLIEFGSPWSPVYAPMRKALRAVRAGRVVMTPKGATSGVAGFLGAGGAGDPNRYG